MKKNLKIGIVMFCSLMIFCLLLLSFMNEYILISTKSSFFEEGTFYPDMDCILILGAGVKDNAPSPMLKDRLDKGIELYKNGYAKKIIMSGDHGKSDYDEVNVMKKYAIEMGVESSDIFMDHAGFSTYDSIVRARDIFEVERMFVVSQEYHLPRALYLAKSLQIYAVGVPAEDIPYSGSSYREIREFLARDKDFIKGIIEPPATIGGNTISVHGDGNLTND